MPKRNGRISERRKQGCHSINIHESDNTNIDSLGIMIVSISLTKAIVIIPNYRGISIAWYHV